MASVNASVRSGWWRIRGRFASLAGNFDSARYFLQQAKDLVFSTDSLFRDQIFLLIEMGWLEFSVDNYELAIKLGLEAYHLAHKKGQKDIAQSCKLLISIYSATGDNVNYLKYLQEGLRTAFKQEDISYLSDAMSDYYAQIGRIDSSIYYGKIRLEDTIMTNVYGRMNKLANIGIMLCHQGKIDDGLLFFHQAIELGRPLNETYEEGYLNLATAYLEKKQYQQARLYADTSVMDSRKQKNWETAKMANDVLSAIFVAQGQTEKSLAMKDSAMNNHLRHDSVSMAAKMQEIEVQYAVRSKDERISSLAEIAAFNGKISSQRQMIIIALSISALLVIVLVILLFRRRSVRLQIREHELQQQLLRSQMEDHFMYNSLSNLQHLIRDHNHEGALFYLGKFSRLVRMNQFNSRDNYIPLGNEISALEAYLALQKIHLNDQFNYEIAVYDGMEDDGLLIPPMLLQPFVENAVVHGIQGLSYPGHILVTIQKGATLLVCRIEDNGRGTTSDKIRGEKPSMSTQITTERLEILGRRTGQQGSLLIRDRNDGADSGTVVILEIPYRYKQPEE